MKPSQVKENINYYDLSLLGHQLLPFRARSKSPPSMHEAASMTPSVNFGSYASQLVMYTGAMKSLLPTQSAAHSGVTAAQIFIGRSSLYADFYGTKTDKEFVKTLEYNIRERGAMDKIIRDCARAETSSRVKDIRRALVIADWKSEPYRENQNYDESQYGTIKAATNRVLN